MVVDHPPNPFERSGNNDVSGPTVSALPSLPKLSAISRHEHPSLAFAFDRHRQCERLQQQKSFHWCLDVSCQIH